VGNTGGVSSVMERAALAGRGVRDMTDPAYRDGSGFPITPQLVVGLVVIFIGVVFALDRLGIAPASSYLRYWPSALIAIGVIKLLQARDGGGAFAGLAFTLVGAWLQAEELNLLRINLVDAWPLALVLFGGYLVWQGLQPRRPPKKALPSSDPFAPLPPLEEIDVDPLGLKNDPFYNPPAPPQPRPEARSEPRSEPSARDRDRSDDQRRRQRSARKAERRYGCSGLFGGDFGGRSTDNSGRMSALAILGAVVRGNNSQAFRGGNLVAIMGGCEIDLRNAAIDGEAVIDVFAMWGGIELRVPADWTVSSQVVPLMGGVEDKTRPPRGAAVHRLTLRGVAFMGGIEIKN